MLLRLEVTIDCAEPARLAPFWCEALHYTAVPTEPPYQLLMPEQGDGVPVLLQAVPEPKVTKNRVHLDLYVEDLDAEVARLIACGARRLDPEARVASACRWVLLADPEGNEFCVCHDRPTGS